MACKRSRPATRFLWGTSNDASIGMVSKLCLNFGIGATTWLILITSTMHVVISIILSLMCEYFSLAKELNVTDNPSNDKGKALQPRPLLNAVLQRACDRRASWRFSVIFATVIETCF